VSVQFTSTKKQKRTSNQTETHHKIQLRKRIKIIIKGWGVGLIRKKEEAGQIVAGSDQKSKQSRRRAR
jgi:esterase/lipase superfamily enzyme